MITLKEVKQYEGKGRGMIIKSIINFIFRIVWRKRLKNRTLLSIVGWNKCRYETKQGQRVFATFLYRD